MAIFTFFSWDCFCSIGFRGMAPSFPLSSFALDFSAFCDSCFFLEILGSLELEVFVSLSFPFFSFLSLSYGFWSPLLISFVGVFLRADSLEDLLSEDSTFIFLEPTFSFFFGSFANHKSYLLRRVDLFQENENLPSM